LKQRASATAQQAAHQKCSVLKPRKIIDEPTEQASQCSEVSSSTIKDDGWFTVPKRLQATWLTTAQPSSRRP
jgi:hypothetical protein